MSVRKLPHCRTAVAIAAMMVTFLVPCGSAFAISSSTLRVLSGQAANDQFGTAISAAGDFNSDGFPDIIVGAPNNDATGLDAGSAYVFYGGPNGGPNTVEAPDTLQGFAAGDHFGVSVAAAGDVNGDGNDDIIVGASGAGGTGRAYVYFGGPSPGTTAGIIIFGIAAGDFFGDRVASAGDFNADGFDDVVVGAPLNDAGGPATDNRGRAYVYFGGSSPNNVADVVLTGQAAGDHFGVVQSGGDFDGDGIDDLFVGAPLNDGGAASTTDNRGRVYLFRGGAAPNTVADLVMTGAAPGDNFGQAVGYVINWRGNPKLIVGAPFNDAGGLDAGRAYVLFGGATADTIPDVTFTGSAASENLGYSVAVIGDVNGDGYDDFAAGSPTFSSETGRVNVYLGGPFPNSVSDVVFNGADTGFNLGWSIAAADLDRDGRPEMITGGPHIAVPGNPGTARVLSIYTFDVYAPARGATWQVGGPVRVRWRGHDVADLELSTDGGLNFTVVARGVGGRDDNSFTMVCPSTPTNSALVRLTTSGQIASRGNSDQSARFIIIYGKPSAPIALAGKPSLPCPLCPADTIGFVVSGDFTGDGTSNVLIGDPDLVPGSYTGSVTIFGDADDFPMCGNGPPPPRPWWWGCSVTFHGQDPADMFGFSLATIGDFNGDGYTDWIVGAPRADVGPNVDAGKAYVYFGGAVIDTTVDLILSGGSAGEQFGFAVAGAGDFNRDGFDDIAVSAPFSGAGSGHVHIFFGAFDPQPDPPGKVLAAVSPGENFGLSLAGRINLGAQAPPDPDFPLNAIAVEPPEPEFPLPPSVPLLLVGAPYNDVAGVDAGAAYGFLGGAAPDTIPDIQLFGDPGLSKFGWAVARAGDVNGDRIDDIAIGAPDDDAHGIDAGRVSVFLMSNPASLPPPDVDCGGPSNPCCPWCEFKWILWGEHPGDRFGASIASMDFNVDGLSDLLIGAPGYDGGGGKLDAGRIYGFTDPGLALASGPTPEMLDPSPVPWFVVDGLAAGKGLGRIVAPIVDEGHLSQSLLKSAPEAKSHAERRALPGMWPADPGLVGEPVLMPHLAILAPARDKMVRVYDIDRFHLLDDMAGVEWQVGSLQKLSWFGNAAAQVDLSIDGGRSWGMLAQAPARPGLDGTGPTGARRTLDFRVPHAPTKFARVRIWPGPWPCLTCPPIPGVDMNDTVFTIRTNIALLSFTAELGPGGAALAWSTDVAVSDQGISGYRLYRLLPGARGAGERVGPEQITETRFTDPGGVPGAAYRLTGLNGLAEELELGSVTLEPAIRGLRVSPSPVSARGSVAIAFAAPQAASGLPAADLDVGVFDVSGRRVADLARGDAKPEAGVVKLTWDLAGRGSRLSPGFYIVRAVAPSAGLRLERKVVVLP